MIIPTLHTDRLILRAPSLDDLPAFTAYYATAQSHMVGGPLDDMGSFRALNAMLGHWITRGFGSWLIADRDTDAFLGRTGFIDAPGWQEPELGWALTAQAQGRGIAHEATLAARAYGAASLGLDATISYIRPDNTRSAALARRLGAVLETHLPTWRGVAVDIWRHPRVGAPAATAQEA